MDDKEYGFLTERKKIVAQLLHPTLSKRCKQQVMIKHVGQRSLPQLKCNDKGAGPRGLRPTETEQNDKGARGQPHPPISILLRK